MSEAALLLDKEGSIVGANQAARDRLFAEGVDPLGKAADGLFNDPGAFRRVWKTSARIEDLRGTFELSPHFDRFGDFVGAVLLMAAPGPRTVIPGLSPREAEVLEGVLAGETNETLAERLFLAPGTVKRHVHEILEKTGAKDRAELIRRFGVGR